MKSQLLFVPVIFLFGCQSCPPTRAMRIESDPPGVRVFYTVGINALSGGAMNREYVGQTPCSYNCPVDCDGKFDLPQIALVSKVMPTLAVFTAESPTDSTNLFTRHQVFRGSAFMMDADNVPGAIFFDLHKADKPDKK